ncbi:MAG TPA: tRNA lysidine(34) synthetase TilS [Bryobacteraceae bacterium]|nr:tRNA lysidine(34) synthetase TilS [Bryobacteraceae bacterium]
MNISNHGRGQDSPRLLFSGVGGHRRPKTPTCHEESYDKQVLAFPAMLETVAATIARYRMFEPGQKVAVAVSGGADSVCLLHVLRELAPRWNLHLSVLHLNHRLRGAESEEDAAFVRSLAAAFALPFMLRETDLQAAPGNLEEAAREARLAFFREQLTSGAADRVALGHTRSDQAETVLFRFLRGAATAGLSAIRPLTREGIARPLIAITRPEVERFLQERGIPWREDSTNRSPEFARNRIRHHLLPTLARDWNPAIVRALAQTADWAQAEEAYWETEIDRLAALHLQPGIGFVCLKTACLRDLPLAAARRLVRRAMQIVKGDLLAIEFAHVEAVLTLAQSTEGHGRLQAPGLDIMRSFDWLRLSKSADVPGLQTRNYNFPISLQPVGQALPPANPGEARPAPDSLLPTSDSFLLTVASPRLTIPIPSEPYAISLELTENPPHSPDCVSVYNKEMVPVDPERLSGELGLRNWRPGDQYQPVGAGREQKIKTFFQEFRIPLWERRHWPVLVDGSSIVWARQFGPAAAVAASPGSRRFLIVRGIGIGGGAQGV